MLIEANRRYWKIIKCYKFTRPPRPFSWHAMKKKKDRRFDSEELYHGFVSSEKPNTSTRPDEHPIHTVCSNTGEHSARYSGGSHSTFSPLRVIQHRFGLTPYPCHCGSCTSSRAGAPARR